MVFISYSIDKIITFLLIKQLISKYNVYAFLCRWLSTTFTHSAAASSDSKKGIKQSKSFTMNLFRGQLQTSQVFPYPDVLNDEQTETLTSLVDPVTKFFKVL